MGGGYKTMAKKTTGIYIIFLGLIALLVAIYFMFFYKPAQIEEVVVEDIEIIPEPKKELPIQLPIIEQPKPEIIPTEQRREVTRDEIIQVELQRLAMSFVERYGSFSNQSNFQNLKDLMVFMSSGMQVRINDYIAKSLNQRGDSSIYYGMSTKAVVANVHVLNEDEGQAVILVKTLRQEATGSINNVSEKNQNVEIIFVKERGAWKVDEATWQ